MVTVLHVLRRPRAVRDRSVLVEPSAGTSNGAYRQHRLLRVTDAGSHRDSDAGTYGLAYCHAGSHRYADASTHRHAEPGAYSETCTGRADGPPRKPAAARTSASNSPVHALIGGTHAPETHVTTAARQAKAAPAAVATVGTTPKPFPVDTRTPPPATAKPASTPKPQPSLSPTPRPVRCSGDLTAPVWFTRNGVAAVDFVLTCDEDVVPPIALVGYGLAINSGTDVPLYSAAPEKKNSYAWRWVVRADVPGTPEPALDGGLRTVVFVKLCPRDAPASTSKCDATSPGQDAAMNKASSSLRGPLLAVTIRERSTFANLTSWVQGLGAVVTALIALVVGVLKALQKPPG